jgi:hypothetical protein
VGGWEVKDGVMQIPKPVEYKWQNWLSYYAKYDAGEINGDFTLTLDIGFNIDAYTREETSLYYPDPNTVVGTDSMLSIDEVYARNFAFGIMKDVNNSLLATVIGDRGKRNGIFKSWEDPDAPGNIISESLYYPYSGQGVGQDIHDKRSWKISRSGDVITLWADGRVFCQTTDNTSTEPVTSGWVVAGSRGSVGIAFDNVELSSSAVPPPTWDSPEVLKNADFLFEEGEGYLVTSQDGKYIGVAEGATTGDNRFGYWVDDGVENGNKSYALNCGEINIHGVEYGPKTTFEGWFKFFRPPLLYQANKWYVNDIDTREMVEGYRGYRIITIMVRDKGWFRNRGGLLLLCDDDGENPALVYMIDRSHYHEYCIADLNIEYGEWYHVSWVRNGEEHLFFVDGVKSQSYDWNPTWGSPHAAVDTVNGRITFKDDKIGPMTFDNMQVTLGNAADHDFSMMFSREDPFFLVDRFTIATEEPEPDEFSGADHFSYRGSIKIDTVGCEANGQASVDVQYKADEILTFIYFRVKFDPDKVEVVSIDRKPDPS